MLQQAIESLEVVNHRQQRILQLRYQQQRYSH